ncbi:hypothetical protein EVAR_57602_1 [Eumeta japonica]|uniref:Single domain-containing protein n=1 Tax=Eumeta variegata TaxID=151549 RepID=A0A4C1XXG7_EUMVA|nr:hypothetical protein EVAR_57602_1 [Eumeta japonica]
MRRTRFDNGLDTCQWTSLKGRPAERGRRLNFPGMCFASTRCATVEPGNTWDLAPFCGRSTCVVSEDTPPRLLELVEDCGPLPLANPKCKLDTEKTNKTAPFPTCCPIFTCEDGAKLEYPELPTPAPEEKKEEEKPKA